MRNKLEKIAQYLMRFVYALPRKALGTVHAAKFWKIEKEYKETK